ncbi:MAG: L-glyceraldehyde 3-phosphate reductase [Bacteroidota bacterium]
MTLHATNSRYNTMKYKPCGNSGLKLPLISLGLWHNFGDYDDFENGRKIIHKAFDLGITHFDLANNYGPPAGSAEINFGKMLKLGLASYRDELIISTKAGYDMWAGPYGNFGSKKHLIASLDQSLQRMGLDYVDIFYHHRWDASTPLEETLGALEMMYRQGKALYIGLSNYKSEQTQLAVNILKEKGIPLLIHQPAYSMLNRWVEPDGLLNVLEHNGVGCICFSPLAQGLLSDRYLNGIPKDSRAARTNTFLNPERITPELLFKLNLLSEIAAKRGQSLAQMAIAWLLKDPRVTSVLVGASTVKQIEDNVATTQNLSFDQDELQQISELID